MSFIKEQQEKARKEAFKFWEQKLGDVWTSGEYEKLDSLISQVVQKTVEEIERRVDGMKDIEIVDYHECYALTEKNKVLTDVQSLLKDITTGV